MDPLGWGVLSCSPMKTTHKTKTTVQPTAQADDGKRYDVFVRDWWRDAGPGEAGWPKGLVPYGGAPREMLAEGVTYAEARELCDEYNSTHEPGRYSRKAEFESV